MLGGRRLTARAMSLSGWWWCWRHRPRIEGTLRSWPLLLVEAVADSARSIAGYSTAARRQEPRWKPRCSASVRRPLPTIVPARDSMAPMMLMLMPMMMMMMRLVVRPCRRRSWHADGSRSPRSSSNTRDTLPMR